MKTLDDIFHRIDTRILRDAPIYEQHVAEAKHQIIEWMTRIVGPNEKCAKYCAVLAGDCICGAKDKNSLRAKLRATLKEQS